MRTSPGMTPISTNTSQTRLASFTGLGCSSISPATPIGRMSSPTSTRGRNEPACLATDGDPAATDKSKMKQGWPASQARQDRAQGRRLTGVYMEEAHVSTGTGRSLDPWQWRGRQEYGLAYGAIGATYGRGRAEVDRGLLSQYRLPPQQERDLEREGRASGASRRPFRHDNQRSCHDRHGKGPPA